MQSRCASWETWGNFATGRRYGTEGQFFCLTSHSASKVHEYSCTGETGYVQSSKSRMVHEYAVKNLCRVPGCCRLRNAYRHALNGGALQLSTKALDSHRRTLQLFPAYLSPLLLFHVYVRCMCRSFAGSIDSSTLSFGTMVVG